MRFFLNLLVVILCQAVYGAYVPIDYSWSKILLEGLDIKDYNPRHNIPTAFAYDPHDYRLYITIPRRMPKVPYTIAELNTVKHPGYPVERAPKFEKFGGQSKEEPISVYQPVIDECRRLWILDVGTVEYTGDDADKYPKRNPTIVAYDLKKDHRPEIDRFEIPKDLWSSQTAFGGFAVDVQNHKGDCSNSFIYLTHFLDNSLIVYDQTTKTAWKITDKSFEPDKESQFDHRGETMSYKVGLFGIALGDRDNNGDRPAYYIAGSSTKVYSVNTKELKNPNSGGKVTAKLHGDRGKYTDAIALAYDSAHKTLFFAESNTRQLSCWNVGMELKPENTDVVYAYARFIFGTDISLDNKGKLWFMSNGHPPIEDHAKMFKTKFDNRKVRIMEGNTDRLWNYSKCNPNYKPPKEIPV